MDRSAISTPFRAPHQPTRATLTAVAATSVMIHGNSVSDFYACHTIADRAHHPTRLVAWDDAALPVWWTLHTRRAVRMQIAPTDSCGAHGDNDLTRSRDGIRKRTEQHLAVSGKEKTLHDFLLRPSAQTSNCPPETLISVPTT